MKCERKREGGATGTVSRKRRKREESPVRRAKNDENERERGEGGITVPYIRFPSGDKRPDAEKEVSRDGNTRETVHTCVSRLVERRDAPPRRIK